MKRILLVTSLLSIAAQVSAVPEYPKLQFAWETAKAFGNDIKNVSMPVIAKVVPVIDEVKKSPGVSFFAGLTVSSIAAKIVDEVIRSNTYKKRYALEKLYENLYGWPLKEHNEQYVLQFDSSEFSEEFKFALYVLQSQLKNSNHWVARHEAWFKLNKAIKAEISKHVSDDFPNELKDAIDEFTSPLGKQEHMRWVPQFNLRKAIENELNSLNGWLPSLTFAGGIAASALVAAHKAGVLPKISMQFPK